jgi:preprotein translocase subunit SecB
MFNLAEVYLRKSNFTLVRENLLKAEEIRIESKVNMNSKYIKENNMFSIILNMEIKGFDKEIEVIKVFIEIEGVFIGEAKINISPDNEALEIFSKVKAPQMLFPFISENIHNLTMRAKVKPLIIPYIDFNKLYFEEDKFSNKLH